MNLPETNLIKAVCFPQISIDNCDWRFADLMRKLFIALIMIDVMFIVPQIVALIKLSLHKKHLSKFDMMPPVATLFGIMYKALMLLETDKSSLLELLKCLLYCYKVVIIQISLWHWKMKNFSGDKYNTAFEKIIVSIVLLTTAGVSISVLTDYYVLSFQIWIGINAGYWIISFAYILFIYIKFKNARRVPVGIVTSIVCVCMIVGNITVCFFFSQIENGHEIVWLNYYITTSLIYTIAGLGMLCNRIILATERNSISTALSR